MEESGAIGRSGLIRKRQSEDVPEELMHLIQSYILDPKEAARTCILSKSWLHAWSTIPTLRFREQLRSVKPTQQAMQVMMIDRTLQRYLRDNIPFETIDLLIPINDQVSDSLVQKRIRPVATRTCVKELSLTVNGHFQASYTLPSEIFSSGNIRKISIKNHIVANHYPCIGSNDPMMIECVSLRVLDLGRVDISEEVLDKLLSTCSLLEEVKLASCKGLKSIKVKNLRYLCKLMILGGYKDNNLEIYDVPNLKYFSLHQIGFHSYTIDSLASVTELSWRYVFMYKAVPDDLINCKSLRVLDLEYVNISQKALDRLLSTCSLLEEVRLVFFKGLIKGIKVKNLRYLCKLMISKSVDNLEISDVPNLSCFNYYSSSQKYFHSFTKDSLASVTELSLKGVIIDKAFLDMIKLKFRFLQNLTLEIQNWSSESFDIRCHSLKRLSLSFYSSPILVKVQVFAPILTSFTYDGNTMPSLVFPAVTPEQIQVRLKMDRPMDGLFFVKMREALMLSSNFDIQISSKFDVAVPLNIDFDDMRRRFPLIPATNLQHLTVESSPRDSCLPDYSPFFDAFFSICHPKYVTEHNWRSGDGHRCFEGNHCVCRLMMEEVMENNKKKGSWADYLEGVEAKNPHNGNWEMLTQDSWKSPFEPARSRVELKLNWS